MTTYEQRTGQIQRRSQHLKIARNGSLIDTYSQKGINCSVNGTATRMTHSQRWKLDVKFSFSNTPEIGEWDRISGEIRMQATADRMREVMIPIDIDLSGEETEVCGVLFLPLQVREEDLEIKYDHNVITFQSDDIQTAKVDLIIEGRKLRLKKDMLVAHSNYFAEVFETDHILSEIQISDVKFDEFETLVKLMKNTQNTVSDNNVSNLLKICDRFSMKTLVSKIEQFLLNRSSLPSDKLLFLADKFQMINLVDTAIERMSSKKDVDKFKETTLLDEFSTDTKAKILDRLIMHFDHKPKRMRMK